MFMDLFREQHLPALNELKEPNIKQYDEMGARKISRLDMNNAAVSVLRTDDLVDFEATWTVLRDMATDDSYREDVLQTIRLSETWYSNDE